MTALVQVDITFTTPLPLTQDAGADFWLYGERFATVGTRQYRWTGSPNTVFGAVATVGLDAENSVRTICRDHGILAEAVQIDAITITRVVGQ